MEQLQFYWILNLKFSFSHNSLNCRMQKHSGKYFYVDPSFVRFSFVRYIGMLCILEYKNWPHNLGFHQRLKWKSQQNAILCHNNLLLRKVWGFGYKKFRFEKNEFVQFESYEFFSSPSAIFGWTFVMVSKQTLINFTNIYKLAFPPVTSTKKFKHKKYNKASCVLLL